MSLVRAARPLPRLARLTTIAHATPPRAEHPEPAAAPSPSPRTHHAVVSIAGEDRPGIVNTFTTAAARHAANIEESKMAILGGDFAMIVYISMEKAADADALTRHIRGELPEFSVSIRSTTPPSVDERKSGLWKLLFEGPDQPGIVAAVSQALATHGGNVHEMETETTAAPFAGYPLFRLSGKVAVDDDALDEVSKALNEVEERFGANIVLNQLVDEE